jgi:hypothetical protein
VEILDLPTPSLLVERGAFDRSVATMAARWPGQARGCGHT